MDQNEISFAASFKTKRLLTILNGIFMSCSRYVLIIYIDFALSTVGDLLKQCWIENPWMRNLFRMFCRRMMYVLLELGITIALAWQVTYPNMMEFFESLGIEMEASDMSFSASLNEGRGCEWGSRNGLSSLFSQKKNLINPYFWQMLREIVRFKTDVLRWENDKC